MGEPAGPKSKWYAGVDDSKEASGVTSNGETVLGTSRRSSRSNVRRLRPPARRRCGFRRDRAGNQDVSQLFAAIVVPSSSVVSAVRQAKGGTRAHEDPGPGRDG